MIQDVTITVLPGQERDEAAVRGGILRQLENQGVQAGDQRLEYALRKKSIDARHGRARLVMRFTVAVGEPLEMEQARAAELPQWRPAQGSRRVVIVGSGPAGLFGALTLLEHGIQPVIVEQGEPVHERKRTIARISTDGVVDAHSNYCFGEGGAGTFSDGKLYTRSNKRGSIPLVLGIFAHFGADPRILTDAHPHIGTDRLPAIVQAMRRKITELGGQILFGTSCDGFLRGPADGLPEVRGIVARDVRSGTTTEITADAVLLATGHSAADAYRLLARTAPAALEAKTFAVGVRVEHPRAVIDAVRYHGRPGTTALGAAEYRFTSQQEGRGVYSFCMCPGGFVVPSATAPGQIVVNGMSAAGRNSAWSNAAFVVEVRPEDIPPEYRAQAGETPALAGLLWRTWFEAETFRRASAQGGAFQKAPAQRALDFLAGRESATLPPSSYAPGVVPSRLDAWLPESIARRLAAGLSEAGRTMRGFLCPEALLIAAETRTSTPVRILRNNTDSAQGGVRPGECTALRNLYPAGEGSGYSGGIVSSAMDGMKQCARIASWCAP